MTTTNRVMQEVGEYTIMFFHVNEARTHFRLMNDHKGRMQVMREQTWHVARKLIPDGAPFICVPVQTVNGRGKSGASFRIIGVLACYPNYEEAEEVSKEWRGMHKYLETDEEKIEYNRTFVKNLRETHEKKGWMCDFSTITMNKFLELTEGAAQ